ncbi:MAG: helix-turn-helix transcriptional regulator [Deltaproteobacteria bacterium]|nr:helix-turn-helix transcriptional regulator [Deltaproteobacteria bacterium]
MNSFEEIMQKRTIPGILVLNSKKELLYLSDEAKAVLESIKRHKAAEDRPQKGGPVPDEVYELCERVKDVSGGKEAERASSYSSILFKDDLYTLRAVPLFRSADTARPSHVMIIMEEHRIRQNSFNLETARSTFGLTERETQVVSELIKGSTNQEVAEALSISEHTVKDHIKKIMNKLGVKNRALIICTVLK